MIKIRINNFTYTVLEFFDCSDNLVSIGGILAWYVFKLLDILVLHISLFIVVCIDFNLAANLTVLNHVTALPLPSPIILQADIEAAEVYLYLIVNQVHVEFTFWFSECVLHICVAGWDQLVS